MPNANSVATRLAKEKAILNQAAGLQNFMIRVGGFCYDQAEGNMENGPA